MSALKPYKQRHSFAERVARTKSFAESDPDKVMVIVEKHPKSKLPNLSNSKFLAFKSFQFKQIRALIAKRLKQVSSVNASGKESFFLFVKGNIPELQTNMQQLYKKSKDEDGALYITYQEQDSYGYSETE